MSREYTYLVLEAMEQGLIDPKELAEQLAFWVSERDMKQFYWTINFPYFESVED